MSIGPGFFHQIKILWKRQFVHILCLHFKNSYTIKTFLNIIMAGLIMTIISKNTAFITKKINNNSRNRNNNYNDFNQMTKLYSSSINIDYFIQNFGY